MIAHLAIALLPGLPLAGAMLAALSGRIGGAVALAVAAGVGGAVLALAARVAGGSVALAAGGWQPPLGIALRADGLAVGFLAMAALVMTGALIHAREDYPAGGPEQRAGWAFWPLALVVWAALNAIFLSRDLFNLYVGLELLTLGAVGLVALDGKPGAIAAALRYFVFALAGSMLYLLGCAFAYAAHGALDIALLGGRTPASTDALAGALLTAGLAVKTALFPFHAWLPPAHSGAPAPASALLSALVPKASFYILLRVWFEALPDIAGQAMLWLLGWLGVAAVLYGSVLALRQERLKLLVAYSTVAQIGYLFLVFPLAGGASAAQPWAAGAWTGAVFQALSHGLAKAAMFLCAGLWLAAVGHDRLEGLHGMARATPMATFAFGLAAVTLMGLPPSGGFTAKYLMMTAAFASGGIVWAAVLAVGGLLAAAYLYRPLARAFVPAETTPPAVPRTRQAVPLALAAAAILLGLASAGPFGFLQIGRPPAADSGLE
jgi:multicomponent Na+:H+ antiporter subunit D